MFEFLERFVFSIVIEKFDGERNALLLSKFFGNCKRIRSTHVRAMMEIGGKTNVCCVCEYVCVCVYVCMYALHVRMFI